MKEKNMKHSKLGNEHSGHMNRIALGTVISIAVIMIIGLINIPSLHAFFSDRIEGSSTIKASELGVEVTEVKSPILTYGNGSAGIYGDESSYKLVASSTETVDEYDNRFSDGYILPVICEIKNTSKITEDLYPKLSLEWKNFAGTDLDTTGIFYVYDGGAEDEEILEGEVDSLGSFTNNEWTASSIPNNLKNIPYNETRIVKYKILFARNDKIIRSENGVALYDNQRGPLTIKPGATAVLPGSEVTSKWYAEDEKEFEVITNVFAVPYIGSYFSAGITNDGISYNNGAYALISDNVDEEKNKIHAFYDTESGHPKYYSSVSKTYDYPGPYKYEVVRNVTTGTEKTYDSLINPEAFTEAETNSAGQIIVKEAFIDSGIPWNTECKYKITSYDDYGKEISYLNNTWGAAGDGGFVKIPDSTLRRWLKCYAYDVSIDESKNILQFNYVSYSGRPLTANKLKQLTDLNLKYTTRVESSIGNKYCDKTAPVNDVEIVTIEGLQYAKNATGIYLDNNKIVKLSGEGNTPWLPGGIKQLSLNENTTLDPFQLYQLGEQKATLIELYLNEMGANNTSFNTALTGVLANYKFEKLEKIGLSNNGLSSATVEKLATQTTLQHIDLTDNPAVKNVSHLFGVGSGFINLTYYNVTGTGEKTGSTWYEQIIDNSVAATAEENIEINARLNKTGVWIKTEQFYYDCIVYANGNQFIGITSRTEAASGISALDDTVLQPSPEEESKADITIQDQTETMEEETQEQTIADTDSETSETSSVFDTEEDEEESTKMETESAGSMDEGTIAQRFIENEIIEDTGTNFKKIRKMPLDKYEYYFV